MYKMASRCSGKESDSCGMVRLNPVRSSVKEMSKSSFCEPVKFSVNAYDNMSVVLPGSVQRRSFICYSKGLRHGLEAVLTYFPHLLSFSKYVSVSVCQALL